MSQKTRLVIGKFNRRLGYLHLINVGASKLDHLDVVCMAGKTRLPNWSFKKRSLNRQVGHLQERSLIKQQ